MQWLSEGMTCAKCLLPSRFAEALSDDRSRSNICRRGGWFRKEQFYIHCKNCGHKIELNQAWLPQWVIEQVRYSWSFQ
jgi:hypothetical protein